MRKLAALPQEERELISALDENSRLPAATLAHRLGQPEESVRYRINRLLQDAVIINFFTVIDVGKLGNCYYKVLLKLRHINELELGKLVSFLTSAESVNWVARLDGTYHLAFTVRAAKLSELHKLISALRAKFGSFIALLTISINIRVEFYSRTYLNNRPRQRTVAAYSMPQESKTVDDSDIKILRSLSLDARMPATSLAKEVGLTSETVGKRIKRLEAEKVITGYRVVLNVTKLGINSWYVLVYSANLSRSEETAFMQYCQRHPNINYLVEALGDWQFELNIEAESLQEYRKVVMELTREFPDLIRDYLGFLVTDVYKLTLAP